MGALLLLRAPLLALAAGLLLAPTTGAQPLPTVTVTFIGNAQTVGVLRSELAGFEDFGPPVSCGLTGQGAPGCGFPAGRACCVIEIPPQIQGRTAQLAAPARRGISGGSPGEFGAWGGACAQDPEPCPFPPAFPSPRRCLGGADLRGALLSGLSRTDEFATFGCELVLPSSGNVDVVLHWNKVTADEEFLPPQPDIVLPPTCGFYEGEATPTCLSPPRESTAVPPTDVCGDATADGAVTEADAGEALRASVGALSCLSGICDVNGDGRVTPADALLILRRAAEGAPALELCPAPWAG